MKKQQDAAAKVHDAVIAAMNELHDALKPEQRVALVDKIKAHAAVWKSQNHDEADSKEKGSRLAHLKETLKLTDDQVTKIQAALKASAPKDKPDWSEVEKHMDAFEKAFEADKFDAKTLTTANAANTHIARWGEGRLVRFVEAVVPVLTPDQQKQFAEHLKERLTNQHGRKRRGFHEPKHTNRRQDARDHHVRRHHRRSPAHRRHRARAGPGRRHPAPEVIATLVPVYHEGHAAYWWHNRWHYREGAGWRRYHVEPEFLRGRRTVVVYHHYR